MRISDWSSDVCSSDLLTEVGAGPRIAIDAMGGDEGVRVMIAGVALARHRHEGLQFNLYGDETRIKAAPDNHPNLRAAAEVFHTAQPVPATANPSQALRNSKKSSIGPAITTVKAGEAGRAVSAGKHIAR